MSTLRAFLALSVLAAAFPVHAAGGTLTLSAAGVSPGSVPLGASRVEMLTITFRASCDADIRVDSVRLRHEGLGDGADIERVYLTESARRISRAQSFSGDDATAQVRLNGFTVLRCTTRTLSVLADFSAGAGSGGEHRIILGSSADVQSDAANVTLESLKGSRPARATPSATGSIDAVFLPLNGALRYGANRIVSRIRLDADGGSDHTVNAITLTNDGSARDADLRNLWIEVSGKQVTPKTARMSGNTVTLTFDPPLRLDRNASRMLQLRADVRASRRRTIRFILEEPSDLDASLRKQRGA